MELKKMREMTEAELNAELMKIFKDKVVGFPTLMEVIK